MSAAEFLRTIDPIAATWTFQTFDDSSAKRPELVRTLHGTLEQHMGELTRLNKLGAGVYVTINETDGKKRKAENITRVRAVFADFDTRSPDAPERLRADSLPPSIIVQSSLDKWHPYWLADGIGLDEFKAIQQRIIAKWNSDPKVCDLPRVMRLPGFDHRKAEPYVVKMMEISGRRYCREEILNRYPVGKTTQKPLHAPSQRCTDDLTPYAAKAFETACSNIASAGEGTRNDTLNREAFGIAQLVAGGEIPETEARDNLASAASAAGLSRHEITATMNSAFEAAATQPRNTPERSHVNRYANAYTEPCPDAPPPPPMLMDVDLTDVMDAEPVLVAYAVKPWLPKRHVTLFGGHGGMGKSTVALAIAAHVACGRPFAGLDVEQSDVLFVSLEDEASIVRLRLRKIIEAYNLPATDVLLNMRLLDGTQAPAAMMTEAAAFGVPAEFTQTFREAANAAEGCGLVIIDNASDAFDANENSRRDVRRFVRALADVARSNDAALMLLAHIDKAAAKGAGAGNDYSGSTAWHNSARSRLALMQKDEGLVLEHQKANLSKPADPLMMEFVDGVPKPMGCAGSDGITKELWDQAEMMRVLKAAADAGVDVPTRTTPGNGSAMQVLDQLPEYTQTFKGSAGRKRASAALVALKRLGRIAEESYTDANRNQKSRFVLTSTYANTDSNGPPEGGNLSFLSA